MAWVSQVPLPPLLLGRCFVGREGMDRLREMRFQLPNGLPILRPLPRWRQLGLDLD